MTPIPNLNECATEHALFGRFHSSTSFFISQVMTGPKAIPDALLTS